MVKHFVHHLGTKSQHLCNERKNQKALGGCYGNRHKLDQYLAALGKRNVLSD